MQDNGFFIVIILSLRSIIPVVKYLFKQDFWKLTSKNFNDMLVSSMYLSGVIVVNVVVKEIVTYELI